VLVFTYLDRLCFDSIIDTLSVFLLNHALLCFNSQVLCREKFKDWALVLQLKYVGVCLLLCLKILYYNLVAGMVVSVVDPQPGERIIDCCAAPGGKTLYMASQLSGQGILQFKKSHIGQFEVFVAI